VLVIVPTEIETALLFPDGAPWPVVMCGFGLAAAGAGAAHAIAANRGAAAEGVVLIGAAGTYDPDRHPIGSAVVAGSVRCHGIGAGGRSAAELGFAADDTVELGAGPQLLSVATAAASPAEAGARRAEAPQAAGEEMEGYAVALAAKRFGVRLTIVRGFSNLAGERDRGSWRMEAALGRAAGLLPGVAR
jgi:nucleoside phosphorylase